MSHVGKYFLQFDWISIEQRNLKPSTFCAMFVESDRFFFRIKC